MSDPSETERWQLPLLAVGQMQKEVTHNEALARIDALLVPIVEGSPQNAPPMTPVPGQCWLVGSAPVDAWVGHPHEIASWTSGGWRWVRPRTAMAVRLVDGRFARFDGVAWILPAALAAPVGGTVIDSEARDALAGIILALRAAGLLSV